MAPNKDTPAAVVRMKSIATTIQTRLDGGIITLRYEEARAAKPPIAVTVAPPRSPPTDTHPALRTTRAGPDDKENYKRDSGLAPTTSSRAREGSIVDENPLGIKIEFNSTLLPVTTPESIAGSPRTRKPLSKSESMGSSNFSRWKKPIARKDSTPRTPPAAQPEEEFSQITTTIPTENLLDENFLSQMSFSKRGSMMLGGRKAVNAHIRPNGGRRQPSFSMLATPTIKVMSEDVEKESQKVRSMYEQSTNYDWEDGIFSSTAQPSNPEGSIATPKSTGHLSASGASSSHRPGSARSARLEHERAGGVEDWQDINEKDVDRYGFINMQRKNSRPGTPEPGPPQRVSTILQLASDSPRKQRIFGRSPSSATSSRDTFKRVPGRKVSARSLNTQTSNVSSTSTSRLRAAANRLPYNKDRRWMDEAGDMLTLPPGLADIAEDEEGGKTATALKKKEWERAEKWRKMAKIVKRGKDGEGMEYEFDARSPKLIERTWKGIPDRWRSAAWHSFLSSSATKHKDSASDAEIIEAFHKLLPKSSPDDVQIDIDVPRTINCHIMFRRRYRGGQRLLFRVLHALSLYFPVTGYVQGMASLAATLLCYYDEEHAFVMLVRMWTLRGLDKLYEAGFEGLMAALDEFQAQWLDGGDVAKRLAEHNIEPTAYGTRWYLTLFNYSIPFPAQLRVWDVFMLLGDADVSIPATKERPFSHGLDIIHATSAALIDGTREILMDGDFENAMKVLTSWIPVKDEELLMRVTRAEWKMHRKKR